MKSFLGRLPFGFLAVLFGLSSLALSFSPLLTSQADAAFGVIPNCQAAPVSPKPYLPPATAADVVRNQYPSGQIGSLDWNDPDISAVFGMTSYFGGTPRMVILWNGTSTPSLGTGVIHFSGDGSPSGNYIRSVGGGWNWVALNNDGTYFTGSRTASPSSVSGFGDFYCIEESKNAVYDPGYTGEDYSPPPPDELIFAHFRYVVSDNVVTVNYIGDPCIPTTDNSRCIPPKLGYMMQSDGGGTTLDFKVLKTTETYSFTFAVYAHYDLIINYVDYGEIPYDNLPDGYNYGYTAIQMYINGVNNYTHDSLGCYVEDNFCIVDEVSPYLDCSIFYTTITTWDGGPSFNIINGDTVNCVMNNFGILLKSALYVLFVPDPSFFQDYWNDFSEFLNTKLGMLYTSIAFVFGVFGTVITNGASTACLIAPPGELFGSPVSFDICSFEEVVGNTVFVVLQSLVISLTVLALIFALYRKYQEVVDKR